MGEEDRLHGGSNCSGSSYGPADRSACGGAWSAAREAHALVHEWPHGHELRVLVDGELRWAKLFRGDTRRLDAEADHKREQLEARGWTLASSANDLASKLSPCTSMASS